MKDQWLRLLKYKCRLLLSRESSSMSRSDACLELQLIFCFVKHYWMYSNCPRSTWTTRHQPSKTDDWLCSKCWVQLAFSSNPVKGRRNKQITKRISGIKTNKMSRDLQESWCLSRTKKTLSNSRLPCNGINGHLFTSKNS